jgi:hypothetical protein
MDYLKELSIKLGGKIYTQNLHDINFNEPSYREVIAKDYKGYKIEIDEYGNLFSITLNITSDFTISINNPDMLSAIDNLRTEEQTPYNLYIWKESYSEFIKGHNFNPFLSDDFKIFWKQFIYTINNLRLLEDETIGIREYCICLTLHSDRNIIEILNNVIDVIENNCNIFRKDTKERIFKKNIPENLKPLIPLLKKWSIPDDSEREQLMEETSEKQKKKIVKTVGPYMVEINKFLDSFGDDALSHEAILLGNLAELVSELQIT